MPCVFVNQSWTRPPRDGRADAPFTGYANPQQIWMIARSSGTTGEAKYIGLSEASLHQRATENNFISEAERPVYLALFPLLAYTGTLAMMRTLAMGGTFIYADPQDVYGRTRIDVMHGSPAQLQQFMDSTPPGGSRIPLARMGGGLTGAGLFRRLLLYFDRIMHVYGSTEAATTATRIMGAAEIGDVTPSVGRPVADGDWHITGRVNDQLNVGGVKLNPAAIDTVLLETPGIRDGACFAWMGEDGLNRVALAVSLAAPVDVALMARTTDRGD